MLEINLNPHKSTEILVFDGRGKPECPRESVHITSRSKSKPGTGHTGGGRVLSSTDTLQNQITSYEGCQHHLDTWVIESK